MDRPEETDAIPYACLTIKAAHALGPRETERLASWLEEQAARLRTDERYNFAPRYRARLWRNRP